MCDANVLDYKYVLTLRTIHGGRIQGREPKPYRVDTMRREGECRRTDFGLSRVLGREDLHVWIFSFS